MSTLWSVCARNAWDAGEPKTRRAAGKRKSRFMIRNLTGTVAIGPGTVNGSIVLRWVHVFSKGEVSPP